MRTEFIKASSRECAKEKALWATAIVNIAKEEYKCFESFHDYKSWLKEDEKKWNKIDKKCKPDIDTAPLLVDNYFIILYRNTGERIENEIQIIKNSTEILGATITIRLPERTTTRSIRYCEAKELINESIMNGHEVYKNKKLLVA
jgi:hypothetical protein